jgi:hypothetical protein
MSVLASAPSVNTEAIAPGAVAAPAPSSLLRRLLFPSFADWFFVALLVWLFIAGPYGWSGLLADGDVGWHIRTGQYILSTHTVPHADLFSFSRAGQPWFAWEWLSDIVFALLYAAAGLKGVVLFAGVLIAAYGAMLVRYMAWRGANGVIAAMVGLVAVGASSIHFLARPHLFTLIFFVATLWLLEADSRRPSRALWLLVPLTTLWTNLHGGFVVIFIVLGLYALGALAEGRKGWPRAGRYSLLFSACAAATLVNPYGWGLHRHLIEYLRSDWIRSVVQEFQAPTFRSENQFQFEMLLLAGVLAAGACLRRMSLTQPLLVVGFAHLALTSARHIPLFAVVSAPIVASEGTRLWTSLVEWSQPRSVVRILGAVAAGASANFRRWSLLGPLAVLALAVVPGITVWPSDFPTQMFPVRIIAENTARFQGSRVLTTDQWADYLLFRFWPSTKVFVDGRTDFYGPRVGGEYIDLWHGQGRWRTLLNQYGFQTALIPPDWPLCALLREDPAWREIRRDKLAVLFARVPAAPANAPPGSGPATAPGAGSGRAGTDVLRNREARP